VLLCSFKIFLDFSNLHFPNCIPSILSLWQLGESPDIDEGSFEPPPDPIIPGDKTVQIGTPGYVLFGNDVTIECTIVSGTRPITIMWFRNGVKDTSFGNVSMITVSNVGVGDDRDVHTCRAENSIGFDEETTVINVFGECSLHVSLIKTIY